MGSAIAVRERRPTVPGTPENKAELVDELRSLIMQLKIEDVLRGWGTAVQIWENEMKGADAYLLVLDASKKQVTVESFMRGNMATANAKYLEVEKENAGNPDVQAVLVSVDSLVALRTAYPNYYLDTSAFLGAVRRAIQ